MIIYLLLLIIVKGGRINPYGARFITMSNVNPSGWSEYNFTMLLDSELPEDGFVEITFPKKDYPSQLGLGTDQRIFAPYPNQVTALFNPIDERSLQIFPGGWPAGEPLTVTIQGIKNSAKAGGTGNFKIFTKVGSYIIDSNENFAVIGLAFDTLPLISASMLIEDGYSSYAGEITNYIISLVSSEDLPSSIEFRITFPLLFDLSYLYPYYCGPVINAAGWQPTGNFICNVHKDFKNLLIILGNTGKINKGQEIIFRVKNVINPPRKMKTALFQYQIMEAKTNNTLQSSEAIEGLSILAGRMKLVSMTTKYPSYLPYTGYLRDFVLQFRPKNPFNMARITTDFFQVMSCQITRGLLDKSENEDSVCTPSSRLMILSNFATYQESDFETEYIEVQFRARIDYKIILTNPVEIYTYFDDAFLELVDQETDSIYTRIQTLPTPLTLKTNPAATITTSINTVASPVVISIALSLLTDYIQNNLLLVEIPDSYIGIPLCEFKLAASTTFVAYPCTFSNALLTLALPMTSILGTCPTSCPNLRISNLFCPQFGGTYEIRVLAFGSGATFPTQEFNKSFVIPIPQFSSSTVSPSSNLNGGQTIINVDMLVQDDMPAGVKTLPDPFVSYSRIEVFFYQVNLGQVTFDFDLGLALADLSDPGCAYEVGFAAAVNYKIACSLRIGSTSPTASDYASVTIMNYAALVAGLSGVRIKFDIPVVYPMQIGVVPQVAIRLIRYDRKVKTVVRQQTFTLSSTKNVLGSPITINNALDVGIADTKLQSDTTITYYMKTIFNIPTSGTNCLYYQVPPGFNVNIQKLQVSIDDTYIISDYLFYFPIFKLLIVKFPWNFASGKRHKVQIEKIDLPISLSPIAIQHQIKTTLNGQFADSATYQINGIVSGTLAQRVLTIDNTLSNFPYANYTIEFQTTLNSFDHANIVVDFGVQQNFNAAPDDPVLDNIPNCGLYNISKSDTIQYSFVGTKATISHFAALVKKQRVVLQLFGIINPVAGSYSLTVKTLASDGNTIESGTLAYTIIAGVYLPFTYDITDIWSLPSNQNLDSIYYFKWTTPSLIPKNSQIILNLPLQITNFYTWGQDQLYCKVKYQGSYLSLRQCGVGVNLINIITNGHIELNKEILIEYYGKVYFIAASSTVTGFSSIIKYHGQTIALSGVVPDVIYDDILTSNQIISTAQLDFFPQNEGEIAYYIFTMPLVSFDFKSTYKILIEFPQQYDFILGLQNLEITSTTLQGALKYFTQPRHLFIYGFYDQADFTGTLNISVFGIINPNRFNNDPTNYFKIGILENNKLLVQSDQIQGIIPQLAPEGIQLISLSSTITNCRYTSDYTFQFSPLQEVIPSAFGGQLYIDFPPDFIIDQHSGQCDTTKSFSFFSSCKWDYFRFFLQTTHPSWIALVNGQLAVQIYSVRTPDLDGETSNFVIYNYDFVNKIVLGRTYSNLYIASMIFAYDGLQIDVNLNQAYDLEVGSYSDSITLNVTLPSRQAITLSPNVLDSRILIQPNPVQIGVGSTEATFRLAAPRDILLKAFYITWSKTGDSSPPTYAPLRKTKINMVRGTLKRVLNVESMEYIPQTGKTYPLYLFTDNPPYQEVLIDISFMSDMSTTLWPFKVDETGLTDPDWEAYKVTKSLTTNQSIYENTLANLSSTELSMKKLMNSVNYTIGVTAIMAPTDPNFGVEPLKMFYSLSGFDCDSFKLNTTYQNIQVREQEERNPKILGHNILNVTRTTASFQIFGDTKGFIFYVYADQHMPDPIFNGTRFPDFNKTLNNSNPIYGIDYIRADDLDVNFTISSLTPNHDYEIFVFIMNMNQVYSKAFRKIYFKTMKPQATALFTMKIQQQTVAKEIKLDFIARMTDMIKIQKSRIQERSTTCKQTQLDVSTDPTSFYLWNLVISADPANMDDNTSPLALAETLNSRRSEIQAFIARLSDEPFVTIKELPDDIPNFVLSPEMVDRTITSISLRFSMSKCGMAYLVMVERSNSTQSSIINETNFALEFPDEQLQYNLTDLKEKTLYDIYISLENDQNMNQLLFDNLSVARFTAKTMKSTSNLPKTKKYFKSLWIS